MKAGQNAIQSHRLCFGSPAPMKTHKIPDSLNNILVVIAVSIGLLSVLQVRRGGGVVWFIALGVCGYFVVAGLYQEFFR
jgi:hypothetical protein